MVEGAVGGEIRLESLVGWEGLRFFFKSDGGGGFSEEFKYGVICFYLYVGSIIWVFGEEKIVGV